jgi:hypothetical protein
MAAAATMTDTEEVLSLKKALRDICMISRHNFGFSADLREDEDISIAALRRDLSSRIRNAG